MRELYVRRRVKENNLGKVVPVKVPDIGSVGFDREVGKQLNLLKEEVVEFRKAVELKSIRGFEVSEKFKSILSRMSRIVEREGCYYPDSIRNEVVSVAIGSGGPVFSNLFVNYNVSDSLKRIPMNCKAF